MGVLSVWMAVFAVLFFWLTVILCIVGVIMKVVNPVLKPGGMIGRSAFTMIVFIVLFAVAMGAGV
jgi:hypothetical protein